MKFFKTICFFGLALGPFVFLLVQEVPEKVIEAFANQFPETTIVDWEQESEGEWEAEFKIKNTPYSASYKADGSWLETAYEINKKDIPRKIRQALEKSFPHYKLQETEKLETVNGEAYEFELENGDSEIEVIMDLKGKVLKTINETDQDDDID